MKARPRQAENRVAEILSDFFSQYGLSPIERIPVLGRTGPDLTMNEAVLVVDVKSRKAVPKGVFKALQDYPAVWDGTLIAFPIGNLAGALMNNKGQVGRMKTSRTIHDWYQHMEEWTGEHTTNGISALVLHIPQMPYGNAALILKQSDVGLLVDRIRTPKTIGRGDGCLRLGEGEVNVITPMDEKRIRLTERDYQKIREWIGG